MKRILGNKAQCLRCGAVIKSKYRHDFVWCDCRDADGNPSGIAVDGGRDYLRRTATNMALVKDLSEEEIYFGEGDEDDNRD